MTKALIIQYIIAQSLGQGVDPSIALTVAKMESNFNPDAVGGLHEMGLFQLNPSSFKQYTRKQLLNPKLNARLAIRYLKEVKEHCIHKEDINWLVCYNYGYKNAEKVKYPHLFPYVVRAKKIRNKYLKEGEI